MARLPMDRRGAIPVISAVGRGLNEPFPTAFIRKATSPMNESTHRNGWRLSIRGLLTLAFVVAVATGFAMQQHRVSVLEDELQELRDAYQQSIVNQQKSDTERRRLIRRQDVLEDFVRDPPVRYQPLVSRKQR